MAISPEKSATEAPAPQKEPAGSGFPWKWAAVGVFGLLALGFLTVLLLVVAFSASGKIGSDCVALIKVNGEILVQDSGGIFGGSGASSEALAKDIAKVREGDKYKALVLEINSPGGSAVASKQIYDEILFLKKETDKPVVAYLGEEAASGGYYVASAADEIVADPNTITGSIGARFSLLNYQGLFEKLGLRDETIKSGELKDIGSPYRNLTAVERRLLDDMIRETAQNFYDDVEAGRAGKLVEPYFSQALDARILSPKMALKAGLVDSIGSKRDAISLAAEIANITLGEGQLEPDVCELERKGGLSELLSGASESFGRGFGSALVQAAGQAKELERASLEYR